ncbi:MAG: LytTR family DNA-binding domain-containing protein [Tannerellaceae bacterium]|jgi:DNA-binding LytR/AlgR family response regulator|nr:LytTR family DNA-binding domain-containing protein [Tannerellaceae bacterium]
MKLTAAIIDDEPLAVALLESYVQKTPFLQLQGTYNSAIDAIPELGQSPVELLFLDIQMPEINGMEFSRIVNPDTRIIFTTAFSHYALDSYKVNALDYLLKPISYADFLQSANKALQWYELLHAGKSAASATEVGQEVKSIFVRSEHKLLQIETASILYIESLKDYVKIRTSNSPQPVTSLMSMQSIEAVLPRHIFIRTHRSYIVNIDNIKIIERNRIVFNKEYIPISDSYRQRFNEALAARSIIIK